MKLSGFQGKLLVLVGVCYATSHLAVISDDTPESISEEFLQTKLTDLEANYPGKLSMPNLVEIERSLTIRNLSNIDAKSLIKIGGNLIISNMKSFYFPKLEEIQGSLTVTNSTSFDFKVLKSIGGDLSLSEIVTCYFPTLKTIHGSLIVKNSTYSDSASLKKLQGNLAISNTNNNILPALEEIYGSLTVTNLPGFSAKSIKEIQGNLTVKNSPGLSVSGLLTIRKSLFITDSDNFSASKLVQVQESMEVVNSDFCSAPSITEIGGDLKFTNSKKFSLYNLKQIKGNLTVINSDGLSNNPLSSLEEAKNVYLGYIGRSLDFKSLKSTTSLRIVGSPLVNITGIDVAQLDALVMVNCPSLIHIPLKNLKSLKNLEISSTDDIKLSDKEPNEDLLKDRLKANLIKPLCAIGNQFTLEGNDEFNALYRECKSMIETTKLKKVGLENMKLSLNHSARSVKVYSASTDEDISKIKLEENPEKHPETPPEKIPEEDCEQHSDPEEYPDEYCKEYPEPEEYPEEDCKEYLEPERISEADCEQYPEPEKYPEEDCEDYSEPETEENQIKSWTQVYKHRYL